MSYTLIVSIYAMRNSSIGYLLMLWQCLQFTPSMSRTQTKRLTEAGQDGIPNQLGRPARKRQQPV
ncbi:MAG: hypothetical protein IV105_16520 [Rhizobacter sp.]|nr:hypothetical protein [Rhizobacter sp.]